MTTPYPTPADELLRIIARGVEVGRMGKIRKLTAGDMTTMARDYCDANRLSYSIADLRVVERAGFLNAGDTR